MTGGHCPIDHEYLAENSGLDLCPVCGDLLPGFEDRVTVRLVPELLPAVDDEECGPA